MPSTARRLAPLYAAIFPFAVAALPAAAQPTLIRADGSYRLGANPIETLSDQRDGFGAQYGSVDVLTFPSSGSSSAGLHSYGSGSGSFGSRSSGYGSYAVTGGFRIRQTVTNTGSTAANAIFNFYITPGLVQNDLRSGLEGADFVRAGITFDVRRYSGAASTSVWGSSFTLQTTAAGTTSSQTGANLYTMDQGNPTYYRIDGSEQTVNLGLVGAGESFEFEYLLTTFAEGEAMGGVEQVVPERQYTVPEQFVRFDQGCYGGYGYGCYAQLLGGEVDGGIGLQAVADDEPDSECERVFGDGAEPYTFPNGTAGCRIPERVVTVPGYTISSGNPSGSHASSGDPFNILFDGSPDIDSRNPALARDPVSGGVTFAPAAVVPEPSTYAMLVTGLGVLAGAARRRRRGTA